MTNEFSHLEAIQNRIISESNRRDSATNKREKDFRIHQVEMANREFESELKFLESKGVDVSAYRMSIDDILDDLLTSGLI